MHVDEGDGERTSFCRELKTRSSALMISSHTSSSPTET